MKHAFFALALLTTLFLALEARGGREKLPLDEEHHAKLERATFALG